MLAVGHRLPTCGLLGDPRIVIGNPLQHDLMCPVWRCIMSLAYYARNAAAAERMRRRIKRGGYEHARR